MNLKKVNWINFTLFCLVITFFTVGIYFYHLMPVNMASHWNFKGMANGFMPKFWGLFLLPLISATVAGLLVFLPRKHRNQWPVLLITGFLFYLYLLTIAWNLGHQFNFTVYTIPALVILLIPGIYTYYRSYVKK